VSDQPNNLVIDPLVVDPLQKELKEIRIRRALNRRKFLAGVGIAGAAVASAPFLAACGSSGVKASAPTENDVLNFALNLEYLEAQFYLYATTGSGLSSADTGGTGTITGGTQVTFTSSQLQAIAQEIAGDEKNHVEDLRSVLGSAAVSQPNINFNALGIDLSVQANFLAVARLFEDVGVSAYSGAAQYLSGTNLTYAAEILAVEAMHSGNLRLNCIQMGVSSPAADSIDIPPGPGNTNFFFTAAAGNTEGIPPGLAPTRTTSQVLAIVYGAVGMPAPSGTSMGGLFPNGVNGTINTV
jgi:hypothetical protein